MHRTITVPQPSFAPAAQRPGRPAATAEGASRARGLRRALVVLAALLLPGAAHAQAPPKAGIIITVNATEIYRMPGGKKILRIDPGNPTVVNVVPRQDLTSVAIVGIAPGLSVVKLTDEDNKVDQIEVVVVAFDIQQLRSVLRQAVPSASVIPTPAGNTAVVLSGTVDRAEDVPAVLQTAQSVVGPVQIINMLRVGGVQQVQLCVTVAQVNRDKLRQFGFNFLFNGPNLIAGSTVGNLIPPLGPIGIPSAQLQPSFAGQILNSAPGATNLYTGVITRRGGFLGFLQALQTENIAKILAEPRLVSLSGRQASFLSGGEQAVPVPAGLGQIGVQFEEFGTRLNFVPIVLGNGKIHLEVEPEVSQLNAANGTSIGGTIVPGRVTQRVRTTVEIEDGQTLVIGGLLQHQVNATLTRVPVLGALPFIGAAFSTKTFDEADLELVIIITPHLIDPIDCSQLPKVLPGQETRSPDDFELFLESILEAPRGSREVCPGKHYVPAYKNGPTAGQYPCGLNGHGGCGEGACGCGAGCAIGPAHALPAAHDPAPVHGTVLVPAERPPVALTPARAAVPAPRPVSISDVETVRPVAAAADTDGPGK